MEEEKKVNSEETMESTDKAEEIKEENTEANQVSEEKETAEPEVKEEERAPEEPEAPDALIGDYNGNAPDQNKNSVFTPLEYVNDGTRTIDEDIERVRKTYSKKLSKSKVFDYASIGVMVLAFIGVLLVTFLNKSEALAWVTWVVLGVAIVAIVASFIVAAVFNKKNVKIASEYLGVYEDMTNAYVLSGLSLTDAKLCTDAKVDDQLIIQAHYFSTISAIQSRAVVSAKRNGLDFSLAEVAVIVPARTLKSANEKPEHLTCFDGTAFIPNPTDTVTSTQELSSTDMTMLDLNLSNEVSSKKEGEKREKDIENAKKAANDERTTTTGIFGKFFSVDTKVSSKEAFIVSYLGDMNNTVLPDYLKNYTPIHVPGLRGNIVVYATDIESSKVFFDDEAVKILNEIVPDIALQSMFISVNSYGAKISMTLSDDIMSLPIKQIPHLGCFDSYKNAVDKSFAFVDYVDSKKAKGDIKPEL